MSALELYAKQAINTKGTQHMQAIQSLRKYIRLSTNEELETYIRMITDVDILRTLIECGMRTPLFQVVISRINMLTKEQQEAKK